jgi:hypothetical protein
VWSGDNQAKDEHILLGALLVNQMGVSGVPFRCSWQEQVSKGRMDPGARSIEGGQPDRRLSRDSPVAGIHDPE